MMRDKMIFYIRLFFIVLGFNTYMQISLLFNNDPKVQQTLLVSVLLAVCLLTSINPYGIKCVVKGLDKMLHEIPYGHYSRRMSPVTVFIRVVIIYTILCLANYIFIGVVNSFNILFTGKVVGGLRQLIIDSVVLFPTSLIMALKFVCDEDEYDDYSTTVKKQVKDMREILKQDVDKSGFTLTSDTWTPVVLQYSGLPGDRAAFTLETNYDQSIPRAVKVFKNRETGGISSSHNIRYNPRYLELSFKAFDTRMRAYEKRYRPSYNLALS